MPLYLVERDVGSMTMSDLDAMRHSAEVMSLRFTRAGKPVRYVRSIVVPGDSRCLCLFEALSAQVVRGVNELGTLPYTRILIVLELCATYSETGADRITAVCVEGGTP